MNFLEFVWLTAIGFLCLSMFAYAFSVGNRAVHETRRNRAILDSIRDMRRRERAF